MRQSRIPARFCYEKYNSLASLLVFAVYKCENIYILAHFANDPREVSVTKRPRIIQNFRPPSLQPGYGACATYNTSFKCPHCREQGDRQFHTCPECDQEMVEEFWHPAKKTEEPAGIRTQRKPAQPSEHGVTWRICSSQTLGYWCICRKRKTRGSRGGP